MRSIRHILLASVLTVSAFSAVTLTSCKKDDEGCAVGYEGSDCKTLSRDKFIGTYVGNETCTVGTDTYTMTITANSDAIKLTLSNLYNNNPSLTAIGTMSSTTTFNFSGSQSGTTFSGNGSLSGNQLTVTYQISDGTNSNSCTYIGTK